MYRLTTNFARLCLNENIKLSRMINHVSNIESVYSDTPQYPPIEKKITFEEKWRKKKTYWHTQIQNLPTVEQKLIELNMPKYYGYWSVLLKEETLRPSCLEFLKFLTRTQVINGLPKQYYSEHEAHIEKTVDSISDQVKELILMHFTNKIFRNHRIPSEAQNENFIIDLNNMIMRHLDQDIPHLTSTAVDLRPRIEGFWFVGGFAPPNVLKKAREGKDFMKVIADEPYDRSMRSSIRPTLALRMRDGLPEVIPLEAGVPPIEAIADPEEEQSFPPAQSETQSVSPYNTDPTYWGLPSRRKRATIVPGFWPGDEAEHGHLFFHPRSRVNNLEEKYGGHFESLKPAMIEQRAVLAGFTQAHAYAFYQGFTPVNELTYPIVQQNISTDGQNWQFGVYQLNTCCLHSHLSVDNPRTNLLWLSPDMRLFESIDGNTVKGFSKDVLRALCSMYLKKGVPRQNANPYLADYKYLMNHEAPEEYKEEFQKALHFCTSERPRRKHKPEVLPWELIYKVYFKTRAGDRKSKFFENQWAENPYRKRMDDYRLPYIPKVRRINHKIKFKPRLNSEHLFKHDWHTLKKLSLYPDDGIAFQTMNIRKDTPPYYNGLLWSRGMLNKKIKI